MAQYDVHRNTAPSKVRIPYLMDIQADLLKILATRVVVPLVLPSLIGHKAIRYLHVEVVVEGQPLVALVSELAAVPARILGPRVSNLAAHSVELVRALDVMVSGI